MPDAKIMPLLLRFAPIYQERVWGGHKMADALGRTLPTGKPIGESWEIVDRLEAQSTVASGPWKGRTLHELIERETMAVMGPSWHPQKRFPVLVKWLDARERLSLQVHPPTDLADKLAGEPKSECWYIAEADKGAAILAGLKRGVTRAQFEKALRLGELEPLVHRFPAQRGASLFVPSGRLHAIDAGNLILEIQQNSDTTYRVYDWGRVGLDGKPRALHLVEALPCIDFKDFEPEPIAPGPGLAVLADCSDFLLRRVPLLKERTLAFCGYDQARLISIAEGRVATDDPVHPELERGANALIPHHASITLRALENSTVLVTEDFAKR